jgi:putative sigma-54 modulation protein
MTINIDRKKCNVNDQVVAATQKKLEKLDKFFYENAVADVKFSELKGMKIAEVTVRTPRLVFRAEERSGDAYAAMDNAIESIVRQILKNKTRLEKRLREGAFERVVSDIESQEDTGVIRRKRFELKPMTEEEATLQMDMLNHKFYLFKNSDLSNKICVVYKRDDGGYGIIESE